MQNLQKLKLNSLSVEVPKEEFFKPFSDFEPDLQAELLKKGKFTTFEEGELIISGGEQYYQTVLIIDGLVKMLRKGENGQEIFMYYLQPGEAAFLSLLEADNVNMSEFMARAEKKTTVLSIPSNSSNEYISRFRTWYYFVIRSYRRRFEELFHSLDSVAFRGLDDRLLDYLKRQSRIFNTKELNVSHKEIASDLNTSREVVSRLLKKMEQRGILTLSRNKIKIEKVDE